MNSPPSNEAEQSTDEYVPHKEPFFSFSTIRSRDDSSKYMTRLCIGRLRLHIIYRGDDDDCHDHPWDFWTFPLTSYVEEVLYATGGSIQYLPDGTTRTFDPQFAKIRQVVPRFKTSFRPAQYKHRILGRYTGEIVLEGHAEKPTAKETPRVANQMFRFGWMPQFNNLPIVTIVWRSPYKRQWGFWKSRAGKWCWMQYHKFLNGGKNAPCE